jgi:hypothetical protein
MFYVCASKMPVDDVRKQNTSLGTHALADIFITGPLATSSPLSLGRRLNAITYVPVLAPLEERAVTSQRSEDVWTPVTDSYMEYRTIPLQSAHTCSTF